MNCGLGVKAAVVAVLVGASAVGYGQGVSADVRPSMQMLGTATRGLTVDHWKTSKAMKEATLANLASIQKDLDGTLTGLVTAADAGTITSLLPLSRNLSALYDVVLRVEMVAETAAPADQASGLEQAMMAVEAGRKRVSERLENAAEAQEKQVADLKKQASVAAAPAPVAAVAPVPCKPVVRKKKVVEKAPATDQ